jgi:hypothetical protein
MLVSDRLVIFIRRSTGEFVSNTSYVIIRKVSIKFLLNSYVRQVIPAGTNFNFWSKIEAGSVKQSKLSKAKLHYLSSHVTMGGACRLDGRVF